jgi:hypothetical protein
MLKNEVVDAVRNKKFHVYSVSKVEEAVEILTGIKSGKKLRNGKFEVTTVFGQVEKELNLMRKKLKPESKKNNNKTNTNSGNVIKTKKKK